jgi:Fe2+ transport system protein FeoA
MMSFTPWRRRTAESNLREGALSEWRRGRDAIVVDVPWGDRLSCRLRELGLLPGVRLRVLRTGTRLVIQIGEARLALRRVDAAAIRVVAADPVIL